MQILFFGFNEVDKRQFIVFGFILYNNYRFCVYVFNVYLDFGEISCLMGKIVYICILSYFYLNIVYDLL